MTARKQPPSRREHVELGAALQDAREAVMAACSLTGTHYPKASAVYRSARTVLRQMDVLRAELDAVSYQELRGEDWSPTIYYGANAGKRAEWLAANPLAEEAPVCPDCQCCDQGECPRRICAGSSCPCVKH